MQCINNKPWGEQYTNDSQGGLPLRPHACVGAGSSGRACESLLLALAHECAVFPYPDSLCPCLMCLSVTKK